jgi:hypothetical protein
MAGDESYEAKGALQWLPYIKTAVNDAVAAGVVKENERTLWENVMLGVIGIEAGGANPYIKRPHGWAASSGGEGAGNAGPDASSDGLTQLIPHHLWADENPFDPLTNIKAGLRTLVRYYRGYGNRWDLAGMEHLTGDVSNPNKGDDAGFMTGGGYMGRIIQINKKARELIANGDVPMNMGGYQVDGLTQNGMNLAPPWDITDPPNLPFDWNPPPTSRAYELLTGNTTQPDYYAKVQGAGVQLQLGNNDEDLIGGYNPFDPVMNTSIDAPMIVPRPATPEETAAAMSNHVPAKGGRTYVHGGFQQNNNAPTWFAESPKPSTTPNPMPAQVPFKMPSAEAPSAPQTQIAQTASPVTSLVSQAVPAVTDAVSSITSALPQATIAPPTPRTLKRIPRPLTPQQQQDMGKYPQPGEAGTDVAVNMLNTPSTDLTNVAGNFMPNLTEQMAASFENTPDPLAGLVFNPSQAPTDFSNVIGGAIPFPNLTPAIAAASNPSAYSFPVNNPNQNNAGWGAGQSNVLSGMPQVDLTSVDSAIQSIIGQASPDMQSLYKSYATDPNVRKQIEDTFASIMNAGQLQTPVTKLGGF